MTIQMNDTHPTVSVAELMRILMDEEGLGWDEAWEVCIHKSYDHGRSVREMANRLILKITS